MAPFSHKKRRAREQPSSNHGVLENWLARDTKAMTTFIHEMSRKKINVPMVLDFFG